MNYTENQQKAINHLEGNLQIIACAGSGKTQVLAEHIVNILASKGSSNIGPANIVAFTFTEKAAGELKDRIHTLCQNQLGKDFGLAEMFVGTIHGFCLNLLQTYQYRFLKYTVINEVQQRLLIDRHSKESGLSDLITHDGKPLKRWKDSRLYQKILSIVREAQIDEATLGNHPIRQALIKYQALLEKKRYLDYSTILTEAVRALITDQALKEKLADRIKFLIVDEYQDVNPLQECLIHLFHELRAQLCVVGDDDQTIYQWNGSDIANIVSFAKRYPAVFQVPLDDNFRSSRGVVETARGVVERNNGRLPKRMRSQDKQLFDYGDLLSLRFISLEEEAQWIADKIQDLRGIPFTEKGQTRGLTWSDCAILLRSVRNSAAPILVALRRAGIPYVVKGMNGLFDTPEVQAAVSIFYYLNDEIDRQAVTQSWNVANLGLMLADIETGIAWLDSEKAEWPQRWQKSTYALQRTYLGFVKSIGLREERINNLNDDVTNRSEIVYYNLGKFSQVITDFEEIHFHSDPTSLYSTFAGFLRHQAPNYYPEGWEDAGFARPDAVQIMTVHQAKGMEFPVVFIPNLLRNRFPPRKPGGRQWRHVIPREAVVGADRYDGSMEDERRLFYVALTRSKKYLYCTSAPEAGQGNYVRPSDFVQEFTASEYVLTRPPAPTPIEKIEPQPAKSEIEVVLTFSQLKYFFECPYQFKLRFLYGFNPGFFEKVGYGKSLHDALAEVHRRALDGDYLSSDDVPALLETHLHLPYAWDKLRDDMRRQAEQVLRKYLRDNNHLLDKIEYAEQTIELKLANGVVVHGRIDLIRRTDTHQVIIIDFKSTDRAQEEDITQEQLHIYAMGYQQLTGRSADLVEVYNLDQGAGATVRELVDENLLQKTEERVITAGGAIRDNRLPRLSRCKGCDMQGVCRSDI